MSKATEHLTKLGCKLVSLWKHKFQCTSFEPHVHFLLLLSPLWNLEGSANKPGTVEVDPRLHKTFAKKHSGPTWSYEQKEAVPGAL